MANPNMSYQTYKSSLWIYRHWTPVQVALIPTTCSVETFLIIVWGSLLILITYSTVKTTVCYKPIIQSYFSYYQGMVSSIPHIWSSNPLQYNMGVPKYKETHICYQFNIYNSLYMIPNIVLLISLLHDIVQKCSCTPGWPMDPAFKTKYV